VAIAVAQFREEEIGRAEPGAIDGIHRRRLPESGRTQDLPGPTYCPAPVNWPATISSAPAESGLIFA